MTYRACIVVPVYNHGEGAKALIQAVAPLGLPTILVNDGSDSDCRCVLEDLAESFSWVHLVEHSENRSCDGVDRRASSSGWSLKGSGWCCPRTHRAPLGPCPMWGRLDFARCSAGMLYRRTSRDTTPRHCRPYQKPNRGFCPGGSFPPGRCARPCGRSRA